MRLLLDTNVLIALEESSAQRAPLAAELSRLAQKHQVTLATHEASLEDFERDNDEKRRFTSITKAGKYPLVEEPPKATPEFVGRSGGVANENDRVDLALLYAIERECADALITEDQGLHKRAQRVGLSARVYDVEQAVAMLTALFEQRITLPPTVENVPLHHIDVANKFFDSLRVSYADEFNDWYKRKTREGRRAWVIRTRDRIDAICIYKLEDPEGARSFKLCTFKVGDDSRGRHLGELLLKTAFRTCERNRYHDTFVEVLADQEFLIDFLVEFGFEDDGLKPGAERERVYRKRFVPVPEPSGDVLDFHITWAPAFAHGDGVRKFFVPIQPKFHGDLFPDAPPMSADPAQLALDVSGSHISSVVGNGIRKAYLSNASITKLKAGDLMLFYRSHDAQSITTLGIVEATLRSHDASAIAAFVGKRTVYSFKEIAEKASRSVLAILFRQIMHLPTPVALAKWETTGATAYQTITEVTDERFARVMEWGYADPS